MPEVTVTKIDTLRYYIGDILHPLEGSEKVLSAIQYSAKVPRGTSEYTETMIACCEAAEGFLEKLRNSGYFFLILLIGPVLKPERKNKNPNYSLSSPLRKAEILTKLSHEREFVLPNGHRWAGLYLSDWRNFSDSCLFLSEHSWSLGIIANKEYLINTNYLSLIYKNGGFDERKAPQTLINWFSLANEICPRGNIVVKTMGSFDDRERSVKFVYDKKQHFDLNFGTPIPNSLPG